MLLVLVATVAATAVTPFGWRVWEYALGIARNAQITAQISEWQPPRFTDVPGLLFWGSVALTVLAVVRLAVRERRVRPEALVGLIAFALLGALASRGVAWWPGVAVVAIAGIWFDGRLAESVVHAPARAGSPLNVAVATLLVLAGIASLPVWRSVDPGTGAPDGVLIEAPSGITSELRLIATREDNVWNPQVWGSWLEFAVPGPRYALDSRIEVFPAQVWSDSALVSSGDDGWSRVLDARKVTIVITDNGDPRLAARLRLSAGWAMAYADDNGAIWVHLDRR